MSKKMRKEEIERLVDEEGEGRELDNQHHLKLKCSSQGLYEMHHEGQDILDALKRPQAYIREEVHEVHHDAPHGDV